MKIRIVLLVILSTFVALAAPIQAQSTFVATIEAAQVVGGSTSSASGEAALTLNAGQDALTYSIALSGLDLDGAQTPGDPNDDVTALHFHLAPPGSNGGVVFGQISPNHDTDDLVVDPVAGTLNGIWEDTDVNPLSAQLAELVAGNLYLNVHTTEFPGGAIRGQVIPVIFSDGFESGDTSLWSSTVP